MMRPTLALATVFLAAGMAPAIPPASPSPNEAQPITSTTVNPGTNVPPGTVVRLMVMREVTTKTARAGDRFPLRVDQDVVVNGTVLIPAGKNAYGEVVSTSESGIVGKSGKLAVRLLYIEMPTSKIAVQGDIQEAGPGGAGTTVAATALLALAGGGPLGLLARGTNAKLKAGDILTARVADDVPASTVIAAGNR